MNIESITELWEADCRIDRNNLTEETLNTPRLHQKYLGMLMECKTRLLKLERDYLEMKELRTRYYNGELTVEALQKLGWSQYQGLKPNKSGMAEKLETDKELLSINVKIEYVKNMIYQLESILLQIKGRDWALRNHIEWQKFQAGN